MSRALEMFVVEGIHTSIPLHRRIMADPDFQTGRYDTNFVSRFMPKNDHSQGDRYCCGLSVQRGAWV